MTAPDHTQAVAVAAFELNGATVERDRFYTIACDPRRSVAVEACAGAGKTWMLVSRMVRALLEGCAPHDILAITFTKKAAGEMRQRLHEWLLQFSTQSDAQLRQELLDRGFTHEPSIDQLERLRQLHRSLLVAGRPVQIRTFHSWFAALLRSAPMQALLDLGLPAHYELLENDAQAVAQVWPRFQSLVAVNTAFRADYVDSVAAHGRHQTLKALEAALSKRVEFALADAHGVVDDSVLPFAQQFPALAHLESLDGWMGSAMVQGLLLEAARALGATKQATANAAALALEQAITNLDLAGVVEALLTKTGTARKFSDKLDGIDTVRRAQDEVLLWVAARAQHQAWLHQQRMARLTRLLVQEYAQLKRERGWIDMGDLERAALALMSDPVLSGWVQERLDARVRHLLIDEFQDTNPLQWQALGAWLSSYVGAGQAPSVFLVGDPKQSIYRFRRAEPQVFKAAQHFVAHGLGGDLLSCDHTRRNAKAIVGLVNHVMEQAQTAGEFDGYRAHSTESEAAGQVYRLPQITRDVLPVTAELASAWRDSLTAPRLVAEETRKTLECRQAARWLAQQLQTGTIRPSDIMVLARKRERLALMQAELARLHIPAQQPEKTELGDCPEVQDLISLLDVLVSPAHDLSLARALKSPIFSVDDADLVELVVRQRALQTGGLASAESNPELMMTSNARVPWLQVLLQTPDLPPRLVAAASALTRWRDWVETLPPHDALSAIYHDGDVLARCAAAAPAVQRDGVLANLRALLSGALQVDGGRYTTAYALVRALRAGGIAAPVLADAHAVRLLTIHGAKGLEARLVLVLDSDGEAIKSQTMGVLVDWPGEARHPQRFVFLASESKPPACVADSLAIEQQARRREELNALYVALTRTQQTLVISSVQPHIGNTASWWTRLHDSAVDAPWSQSTDPGAGQTITDTPVFTLLCLPNMPLALVNNEEVATKTVAINTQNGGPDAATDDLDSRIGQAMHRLLEHYRPSPGDDQTTLLAGADQQARFAREFALDPTQMELAHTMAQAIVQGEGAWAWDSAQLVWQGNEVGLVHQGRMLRIDRLVLRRRPGEAQGPWWVLDYKSSPQPHLNPEHCTQMRAYRDAVAQAQPGQTVRAAFLTAQGTFIELDPS